MSRSLKHDIPGPDWRVGFEEARERGLAALFAELPAPLRLVVEIGFGRGEFLLELAERDPGAAHLGVEYSHKRVLKLARRLARTKLRNLRLLEAPGERAVSELLPPGSVACFWINFPDPWPKARHQRRRLIAPELVRELALRLEPGGELHVATDHEDYAAQIDRSLAGEPLLRNAFAPELFRREVPGRQATAYELEWRAEGRPMHFFCYQRRVPAEAAPAERYPPSPD
jgi:tRNA (guanine-N7-)-methyltransferase